MTIKPPNKKEVIGTLLSSDEIDSKGTSIVLLSVQDSEDEIFTISTSPGYWKKVGKLFNPDSCVKVTFEQRIADVTGYVDAQGAEQLHIASGNNLTGISRFSSIAFQRMLDKMDMAEGVALLSTVEDGKVSAMASYLSAFVRKG